MNVLRLATTCFFSKTTSTVYTRSAGQTYMKNPFKLYFLQSKLRKPVLKTIAAVSTIEPSKLAELYKSAAADSNVQRIGSERIDPYRTHALGRRLLGFYSADIPNLLDSKLDTKGMRVIFLRNQNGTLEYYAFLPAHEYSLFKRIVERATIYPWESVYFFELYNMYTFSPYSKEKQWDFLLRICRNIKFNDQIIQFLENLTSIPSSNL